MVAEPLSISYGEDVDFQIEKREEDDEPVITT